MTQFTSQFAIINKIKEIVSRTGNLFRNEKNVGITEAIARKIQKSAYDAMIQEEKDSFTPPYLSIAEQLQSKNDQIFRGAVFYLHNIAVNEAKNTEEIKGILEKALATNKLTPQQADYVKNKLADIKSFMAKRKALSAESQKGEKTNK